MLETAERPEDFLGKVLETAGLVCDLQVAHNQQNIHIAITGTDAFLLLGANGEVLYALEHLINKIFPPAPDSSFRIVCDVNNFRAVREAELRVMAQYAADQVRKTLQPFVFGLMNSNERRVIHEFLANETDVRSESVDIGNERRLRVISQR